MDKLSKYITLDEDHLEEIDKEKWRKASGVKAMQRESNAALATRHYGVKCEFKYKICVIQGYWIWWCSTHHQPSSWCDCDKLENIIDEATKTLKREH